MAETGNIAEIAQKVSKDIFKHFKWHVHPRKDDNFPCLLEEHVNKSGKRKCTHPTDVVFSYEDPYTGERIHLLTDLKSYAQGSVGNVGIRNALKSLAMSVECAKQSDIWKAKFSVVTGERHSVRGMLFVHNHDGKALYEFRNELKKVTLSTLPIAAGDVIHFIGPDDIQRLYSIANDLLRLRAEQEISSTYSFFYPDLVLKRRYGDVWDQAATFEQLIGPFMIVKHKAAENTQEGFLVYYNRAGATVEEFEYLIDCFSRYQMISSEDIIRIRVCHQQVHGDIKSNFDVAKQKYVNAWGVGQERAEVLDRIAIDRIPAMTAMYNPGDIGWKR